ncbi:MAG TPA: hypothetical protein VMD25_09900 [Acidobacteriaceae bacterium]|nr:hypothetical protein [Acidobacteriaceae bacterium]
MKRSRFCLLVLSAFVGWLAASSALAATHVSIAPIPAPIRSGYFTVTINGRTTAVVHAVSSYYLLNFDYDGPATVSVRAPDAHYWDRGVEIQPMRYGIRPRRSGAVITFRIPGPQNGPVKLSIARPGDHFADSQMLFLFGSPPDNSGITASTPDVRYYGPGVHREAIDAESGDQIYLAPGAVLFGSLNFWQVHDVHVFGRGLVIYDGPQNPDDDTGWMHKRDWHCIVMDHASNIEIDGITCIVRSRTWQIQMENSRRIGFYNVNVIGGSPSNANQDGMDFIGTSDATVRDCFIRASDDDFAIMGNWNGYTRDAMIEPGPSVANLTIEDSVLSTSISNTVRSGWPQKTFESANIVLRNLDVIHSGYGACVVPFSFFEMWTDPEGVETHLNYRISDIRLEDYYSLSQIRQPNSSVRGVTFSNIAAMDGPPMVPSVLSGNVSGVALDGIRTLGGVAATNSDVPLEVGSQAAEPIYEPGPVDASFDYAPALVRPREPVIFRVTAPVAGWHYQWLFGDGTAAAGATVHHAFSDTEGTLLDGSGRFRVLLRAWRPGAGDVWASRPVVVARHALAAVDASAALAPGLASTTAGQGTVWEGWLRLPADGGYTLDLLTSRVATLQIDDVPGAHSPPLRMQVCGSPGDAVQPTQLSAALRAGLHRIRIELSPGVENAATGSGGEPLLYWQGPQTPLAPIPVSALLHASVPPAH